MSSSAISSPQPSSNPSRDQVLEAARAIGQTLKTQTYAIVGGASCSILGSMRTTHDVDIVVPKGATKQARMLLKNDAELYDVDNKTLHTYYKSNPPVEIQILASPSLFQETFDESTPVITIDGINVLKPTLILNAKCRSILGRRTGERKLADAADIQFLLGWCSTNNCIPTAAEVPNASKEFIEWFIQGFGNGPMLELALKLGITKANAGP
ncbi:uncharacterized protein BP5553_02318 [Venustampulla echinocandica]|uniref:Uncharacterized protein n=1 Tax=Venustampulla echinocandica TaxID=2656787 RepID=A0A370U3I0_9HELO|nr:uncharacterized protein BP5553_02318 [Venustampulla echinocandica]RDL42339.1 hypothetical protein BP5553_02318 [Venustampulla echinocandica]